MLHSPLEFLDVESDYVQNNINTSTFTEEPYCRGDKLSLKAGVCGDGIIQARQWRRSVYPPRSTKMKHSKFMPLGKNVVEMTNFM